MRTIGKTFEKAKKSQKQDPVKQQKPQNTREQEPEKEKQQDGN